MAPAAHLLIIDPQVDFCDPRRGALYVKGAERDMERLARFLRQRGEKLEAIHVTLDHHQFFNVAHPVFWVDREGKNPAPFTVLTSEEVESGRWMPAKSELAGRMLGYARVLAKGGRYPLCIWPPHCLIGSPGACVAPGLLKALNLWAARKLAAVNFVVKGANPLTEHYSAVQAEVPDAADPHTLVNKALVRSLEEAEQVAVAGEAASHCVANTVRDLAVQSGDKALVARLVLLEDATSPVPGFEKQYEDFRSELAGRGMRISNTREFLA